MEFDEDMLVKVGLFVLVQALVYFILSKSSNVFSTAAQPPRSFSFRRARTLSIRRMMAALADLPSGGEPYYPIPPDDLASSSTSSKNTELESKS